MSIEPLRRLPFVVRPLPDEPFDSWLEAMASAYRSTVGEVAGALGLLPHERRRQEAQRVSSWSSRLTDEQVAALEESTGFDGDVFRATTRAGFASSVVRIARSGLVSTFSGASGVRGKYCSECLKDSGGRWRLTWEFPFGFACVRHQRLLVEYCPRCHRLPRRRSHPFLYIPTPGHCHNPAVGAESSPRPRRCGGDLTRSVSAPGVPPEVLDAQRYVMRTIAQGRTATGIYAENPQPAIRAVEDFQFLSRIANKSGPQPYRRRGEWLPSEIAAGYAMAWRVVADPSEAKAMLAGRVPVSTSYAGLSPQLQTLIAESHGRKRRITTVLQTSTDGGDPEARAAKLPALLWDDWTSALAPRRLQREVAAGALSAAVVFTGSQLTHAAALALLDPDVGSRRVTHVMRELGRSGVEASTISAIIRLAQHLDSHPTPIDYRRRRQLDCTDLLSAREWAHIAESADAHTGYPGRWVLARAWLHRRLTGNPARLLPPVDEAPPPTGADVDRFTQEIPPHVARALLVHGQAFLAARGIFEPATWAPDLTAFMAPSPAADHEGVGGAWAARRPARAAVATTLTEREVRDAYESGTAMPVLAERAGVSRQSIARMLADDGVTARRGRPVHVHLHRDWLKDQYETCRRTIPEIAKLANCSTSTIARRLKEYGVARPAGSGSEAGALRWWDAAHSSPLLQRVLVGRHAHSRARRFLEVCRHPTLTVAAAALGIAASGLVVQMNTLSRLAGGRLMTPATSGSPQSLTALGRQLQTELKRVLNAEVTAREDPADQEE